VGGLAPVCHGFRCCLGRNQVRFGGKTGLIGIISVFVKKVKDMNISLKNFFITECMFFKKFLFKIVGEFQ
jgi:hypothetical protein